MDVENLKAVIKEGADLPTTIQQQIELGFFSERQDSIIDLAAEGSNPKHSLTEDGETYFFDQPIFINSIKTESSGKESIQIKYETMAINGDSFVEESEVVESDDSPVSTCRVNKFVKAFKISSNSKALFFRNQKVKRVLVGVISPLDLVELAKKVDTLKGLKDDFQAGMKSQLEMFEAKASDLANKVSVHNAAVATFNEKQVAERAAQQQVLATINETIKSQEEKLKTTSATLTQQEAALASSTAALKDLGETLAKKTVELENVEDKTHDLTKKIDERESEYALKTQQVTKLTDDLKKLNSDISLFADDMTGFTKQGDKQIRNYMYILGAVLIIAAALVFVSIHSAYQVFDTFVAKPEIGVINLIGIKVFLLVLMYYAGKFLYQFSKPFVLSILSINQRKLSLSQITILAREFSDSATAGSELDETDRLNVRLQMRLVLIKEYLSGAFDKNKVDATLVDTDVKLFNFSKLIGAMGGSKPVEKLPAPTKPQ